MNNNASLTLSDAVRNLVLYHLDNVHTAMPGLIVDYDYTSKKATIQPCLNKSYIDGTEQPLPLLCNVPVIFPSSADFSFSFPVKKDDSCLVIFSERSIDLWKSVGGQVTPLERRKFDLSDGMAIMGLTSFNRGARAENNEDVTISYKGKEISIKGNGDIIIDGNGTITVRDNGSIAINGTSVAIGNSSAELIDSLNTFFNEFSTIALTRGWLDLKVFIDALAAQLALIKGSL